MSARKSFCNLVLVKHGFKENFGKPESSSIFIVIYSIHISITRMKSIVFINCMEDTLSKMLD